MNRPLNGHSPLVGTVPGTVYSLGGEECLFRPDGSASSQVVTRQVLQALEVCSRIRPLEEQVAAVTAGIPSLSGRESEVRGVLAALVERGLLRSAGDFLGTFREPDPADAAPLEDVAIRTAGGDALGRLLASCLDNERRHGNRYRYWIVDDAPSEEAGARAAEIVAAARSEGLECRFLDRAWQDERTGRLCADAGVPGARGLFDAPRGEGFTGGRAWNVVLVLLAGRRFVMLDDDLVCAPRTEAGVEEHLELEDAGWSLWFHPDRDAAAASGEACDLDPLARHASHLGGSLAHTVNAVAGSAGALSGLDGRRLAGLAPGEPVIATVQGIYGDAASGTNLWLYTATGESRERFWASREAYDRALRSRWITRVRSGHALLDRPTFTPAGLDGTRLLPPTLPTGRDEDFLFGALLDRVHPRARTLNFPWALGHFPDGVRRWGDEAHKQPVTPNLGRFMADSLLTTRDAMPAATAEARLDLAADQLAGIAAESGRALSARTDEYLLFARSNLVRQLQARMAEAPDAPLYWAADVRRIVETNGRALSAAQAPRLAGMPPEDPAALAWLREGLSGFAEGLRAWPVLWRHAVDADGLAD